jgi:general secretion pathway protein F
MPAFEYIALDNRGKQQKGVLEGDTARQIRQQLRDRQLTPLEVSEIKDDKKSSGLKTFRSSLSAGDLSLVTRQLATLLSAGTPLDESLAAIAKQSHKSAVERVITSVRARVMEGYSLSDSLTQFPGVFPNLYRATVAAGEHAGQLDKILERLADYTENYQATQQKITSALIYPVLLTIIAIAVVAGLLGYVVPQVIQVFTNMDQQLPILTRALIATSDAVTTFGPYFLALSIVSVFVFFRLYKKTGFRRRVDSGLLRLPLIGNLIRGKHAAAFTRTLSILSTSGVPILAALNNAAEVVSNLPMREAIETTAERVREGATISGSLQKTGLFPPMTVHLIASGEGSGQLDSMLERAADQQDRETSTTISTALSLFEPALIIIMGIVVLIIVLAILLPIFELNQLVE